MKNCEYNVAKEKIENGVPISKETMRQLQQLNAMYEKEIKKLMSKPDVAKAMYFKQDQFEIIGLINRAKVSEE